MAQSPESRAATLPQRKRKGPSPHFRSRDGGDQKRPKLDENADFVALDSSSDASKESGEISSDADAHANLSDEISRAARNGDQWTVTQPTPHIEGNHDPQPTFQIHPLHSAPPVNSSAIASPANPLDNKIFSKANLGRKDYKRMSQTLKDNGVVNRDKDIHDTTLRDTVKQLRKSSTALTHASALEVLVYLANCGGDGAEMAKQFLADKYTQFGTASNGEGARRVSEAESTGGVASVSNSGNEIMPRQDSIGGRVASRAVENQRLQPTYDYGEMARSAASLPQTPEKTFFPTRLYEISEDERTLQKRYFHIDHQTAIVRCLSCGEEGHMANTCPSRTCKHCGALDQHYSGACPAHKKCTRCRQRGHEGKTCTNLSVMAGGPNDVCDICGIGEHAEEFCGHLWRTYFPSEGSVVKVSSSKMRRSCYNCGSAFHWGGDCPELPVHLHRGANRDAEIWCERYARKFEQNLEVETVETVEGGGGDGGMQDWQLGLLDDGRD